MCCCTHPTINGKLGYQWQPNDRPMIRQPYPPALDEYDVLLYDEPGRCGGIDAHCHHYRLVRSHSSLYLMVQHGGGRERVRLHDVKDHTVALLGTLDSNGRYWMLHTLYYAYSEGKEHGTSKTASFWQLAAAEKRIKVRKVRGSDRVKVNVAPRLLDS